MMSFAEISDLAYFVLIIGAIYLLGAAIVCLPLEFLWDIGHPPYVEYSDSDTEKHAYVYMYKHTKPGRDPGRYYAHKFRQKNGKWKYTTDINKKTAIYISIAVAVILLIEVIVVGISYWPVTLFLDLVFIILIVGTLGVLYLYARVHACLVLDKDIKKTRDL